MKHGWNDTDRGIHAFDRQGSSPNSQQPTIIPHTRQMQSNMKPCTAVRKFSKPTAVQTESSASELQYRQKIQQANCSTDRKFSKPAAVQTERHNNSILIHLP
jgi:hypothetical protein